MDNFDNLEQCDLESDPAAEFLAREQNALAGLQDDNLDINTNSLSQDNIGKFIFYQKYSYMT